MFGFVAIAVVRVFVRPRRDILFRFLRFGPRRVLVLVEARHPLDPRLGRRATVMGLVQTDRLQGAAQREEDDRRCEEHADIVMQLAKLAHGLSFHGRGYNRARGDFARSQAAAATAGAEWDRRLALLPEAALGHALDHLLAFGDPARALAVARRNYALRPYGDAATGLAWALLANHRPADALAAIRPTLAAGWVAAEPHVLASEAYALLGQGKSADDERRAALAINPHALDRNPAMTWLEQ